MSCPRLDLCGESVFMKVIILTKGYCTKVDESDFEDLSRGKWRVSVSGDRRYATGVIDGKKVLLHRYLLSVTDRWTDVDHKDGDTLNNQRENLRLATRSQNNANSKIPKTNTSGYKGVSFCNERKLWHASIKSKSLGRFDSPEEAARHYNLAAKNLWGEFARLNNVSPVFPTIEKSNLNRNNKSGHKGVCFDASKKWSAEIIRGGKKIRLGKFESKDEAAFAYAEAERKFIEHGSLDALLKKGSQSWKGGVPCCFFKQNGDNRMRRISNELAAKLYASGELSLDNKAKEWFIKNGLLAA